MSRNTNMSPIITGPRKESSGAIPTMRVALPEAQKFHNGVVFQKIVNDCRNKPRFRSQCVRVLLIIAIVFGMGGITTAEGWKIGNVEDPQLETAKNLLRDAMSGSIVRQQASTSDTKQVTFADATGGNLSQGTSSFRPSQVSRMANLAIRQSLLEKGRTSDSTTPQSLVSSDIDLQDLTPTRTKLSATGRHSSMESGNLSSRMTSLQDSEITIDNAERVRVRQPAASGANCRGRANNCGGFANNCGGYNRRPANNCGGYNRAPACAGYLGAGHWFPGKLLARAVRNSRARRAARVAARRGW